MEPIAIIGPGRVGTAVGISAARAGWPVAAVGGRDAARAGRAASAIGPDVAAGSAVEAAAAGRIVLLTVPDAAIRPVCEALASAGALASGAVVAHCSGALTSEELAPARDGCGCGVASMHPLQTFPTPQAGVERLPGTHWFLEGHQPEALERLEPLVAALGGVAHRLAPHAKALYHAAACMACNYLVTLQAVAAEVAAAAGIETATWLAAAGPMLRAGLENVLRLGPERALTGPIARGDIETVRRHLGVLAAVPERLRMLYGALGGATVELAGRAGQLDRAGRLLILTELYDATLSRKDG